MTALVFLDTETTGLSLDDEVWEFAAIRREPDSTERTVHLFIEHDIRRCQALPESFLADHRRRFPQAVGTGWHPAVSSQKTAAKAIAEVLAGKPHIVGAVPNFDTERLALLLRRHGREPEWHYHIQDCEMLAAGFLRGKGERVKLPYESDEISRRIGVEPPGDGERHTALGDARWAMRMWDAVMGGAT